MSEYRSKGRGSGLGCLRTISCHCGHLIFIYQFSVHHMVYFFFPVFFPSGIWIFKILILLEFEMTISWLHVTVPLPQDHDCIVLGTSKMDINLNWDQKASQKSTGPTTPEPTLINWLGIWIFLYNFFKLALNI